MSKPIILIDVDGVLVQWQAHLPFFNAQHNLPLQRAIDCTQSEDYVEPSELFGVNAELASKFVDLYNRSEFIRHLPAHADAIRFINRYKREYDFIAVTALADCDKAIMNRVFNLNSLFPGAFVDVLSVNFGEPKHRLFLNAFKAHGHRVEAFIDDLAHNLDDCRDSLNHWNNTLEFDEKPLNIKLVHLKRSNRKNTDCCAFVVKSLDDLDGDSPDVWDLPF